MADQPTPAPLVRRAEPAPAPAALAPPQQAPAQPAPPAEAAPAGTAPAAADPVSAAPANAEPAPGKRKRWLLILAAIVGTIALIFLLYHFLIGVRSVATDNAYVGADTAQVTPLVAGAVASVRVANTQVVHKGDVLVVIDDADARIALARAEADLAQARNQFAQTRATGGALAAQLTARGSDIARAQAELGAAQAQYDKARTDLDRREKLAGSGAVSGDELTAARTAFANARAQLAVSRSGVAQARATRAAANESLAANRAVAAGPVENNPDVAAARARGQQARLDMERTVIRAPIDGVVAQRNVQIGQRVAAGTAIMTIVPTSNMYVDANFKESQLRRVQVGQPAELTSDLYGGKAVYHGKVVGFSGGTGSAFALIPAQNATGNWIKVVQRLPVRIALDQRELADHPLRVGLSMDVSIDVTQQPSGR